MGDTMGFESIDKKVESLDRIAKAFGRWEDGLGKRFMKGHRSVCVYEIISQSPLEWRNMQVHSAICVDTYDSAIKQNREWSYDNCVECGAIKSYSRENDVTKIVMEDNSCFHVVPITKFFKGIDKFMPMLLTESRLQRCHELSCLLANAISSDCDYQLCSGLCSLQSRQREYPHSWIEYKGKSDWCLDSTMNVAMTKDAFYKLYQPHDIVKINGAQVAQDFAILSKSSYIDRDIRGYLFCPSETMEAVRVGLQSGEIKDEMTD